MIIFVARNCYSKLKRFLQYTKPSVFFEDNLETLIMFLEQNLKTFFMFLDYYLEPMIMYLDCKKYE